MSDAIPTYLSLDEAAILAAQLPGLAAYLAANSGQQLAALRQASSDFDLAYPYQGAKYDPDQEMEFPRIDGDHIRDWDSTANAAIVPAAVKRAVLHQADSILDGGRENRLEGQHDGLASQQVGSMSESYTAGTTPAGGGNAAGALCRRADMIAQRYRLRTGRML